MKLSPIAFKPYFLCTHKFDIWWRDYYEIDFFNVHAFHHHHLTKAFTVVQDKVKKGILTHIKEIQGFQKYFETAYIPDDLSQIVRESAITLKEKFMKKMEFLKLPSYVKPEQRYQTAFNTYPPKFPRLPSVEFSVDFSPPFPDWFVFGDFIKILQ